MVNPTRQIRQLTAPITEDGPPSSKGVLNVVAMLEHRPYIVFIIVSDMDRSCQWRKSLTMMLNAKLI